MRRSNPSLSSARARDHRHHAETASPRPRKYQSSCPQSCIHASTAVARLSPARSSSPRFPCPSRSKPVSARSSAGVTEIRPPAAALRPTLGDLSLNTLVRADVRSRCVLKRILTARRRYEMGLDPIIKRPLNGPHLTWGVRTFLALTGAIRPPPIGPAPERTQGPGAGTGIALLVGVHASRTVGATS